MQNKGIRNSSGSKFTLAVDTIINAGKVVCIKNLEMVLPSFSVTKPYFFNKNPMVMMLRVMIKTWFAWVIAGHLFAAKFEGRNCEKNDLVFTARPFFQSNVGA